MISTYISLAQAIEKLFHPLAEIVIHDVKTDKIAYIAGKLSPRKKGDSSLLDHEELLSELNLDKKVYIKLSSKGQTIKSISIPLPSADKCEYLMCINADLTIFEQLRGIADLFIRDAGSEKPKALFQNDWQERLHCVMFDFITDQGWSLTQLNTKQKRTLVKHLFDAGAFREKNAATYIADALDMGRATIFNYLKEWRPS